MVRPQVRMNIPDPMLRPTANPVDTFYQPKPQIPGEAVDNKWLGMASALKVLSPSIERFLAQVEKQKKDKVSEVAALAKGEIFDTDVTDEEVKKNWEETLKALPVKRSVHLRSPGAPLVEGLDPHYDYDPKIEKSEYLQERRELSKRIANMTREEATAYLEEHQAAFPGVVSTFAARPDFILNLKAQLGHAWLGNAERFVDADGNLTTYERARSSRVTEEALAEDHAEWLREFEAPLAEGLDPERGQQFMLGALDALSPIRNRYTNIVEGRRMSINAKESEQLAVQSLFNLGKGVGSILPGLLAVPLEKSLPTDDEATKLDKEAKNQKQAAAYNAGWEALKNEFYAIGARSDLKPESRRRIQTQALQQLAEYYQDIDALIPNRFLDKILSMPRSIDEKGSKTLADVAYWDDTIRGIRESLEKRAASKAIGTGRPDYTEALRLARADAVNALQGQQDATAVGVTPPLGIPFQLGPQPTQSPRTAEEFRKALGDNTDFVASVTRRLVEKGKYSQEDAEDLTGAMIKDIAAGLAQDEGREGQVLTRGQQTEYDSIGEAILYGEAEEKVHTRIGGANLPQGRKNELYKDLNSQEAMDVRELGRDPVRGEIKTAVEAIFGPKTALSAKGLRDRDTLIRKVLRKFDSDWRSRDLDGKRKLLEDVVNDTLKDLSNNKSENGKEVDRILEGSLANDPQAILDSFGDQLTVDINRIIDSRFPDAPQARDSEGRPMTTPGTGRPVMEVDINAEQKRQAAKRRARAGIMQFIDRELKRQKRVKAPEDIDPSDVTKWAPNLLELIYEGETYNDIINKALGAPGVVEEKVDEPTGKQLTQAEQRVAREDENQAAVIQRETFESGLSVRIELGPQGIWVATPREPITAAEALDLGVTAGHAKEMLIKQRVAAEQNKPNVPERSKGDEYTAYKTAVREHLSARDKKSKPFLVNPGTRGQFTATEIISDPRAYPSENESIIFHLSGFIQGDHPGRGELFLEWAGDWHFDNGQELYGSGGVQAEQWMNKLRGEIVTRGLLLEEIILGRTREGVSLKDLGWGEVGDIPWQHMIIGSANNESWTQDFNEMMPGGELVDNWENTILGQALTKLGVDPTIIDKRFKKGDGSHQTQWDWFWQTQGGLRDLREDALGPEYGLRDRDRYLHDIPRMDTSSSPEKFWDTEEQGSPASISGNPDHRMWNKAYENSNERTRAFQKEVLNLRNPNKVK